MIPWFDILTIQLGPLSVDLPTCIGLVGAVAVLGLARHRAIRTGLSVRQSVDGVFVMLLCSVFFGHVFDIILYRTRELRADWQLILPWRGGFCSIGAFVGLVLSSAFAFRAHRGGLRWKYLDQAAIAFLFGLGILRVGCFLGHHHAGRLSQFWLAVAYPGGARHDLGLEEAIIVFGLLAGFTILARKSQNHRAGCLCASAVLSYGIVRFALEWLRGDDIELMGRHSDPRYAGLTAVQYASLLLMTFGAMLLVSRWGNDADPVGDLWPGDTALFPRSPDRDPRWQQYPRTPGC